MKRDIVYNKVRILIKYIDNVDVSICGIIGMVFIGLKRTIMINFSFPVTDKM